MNESARRVRTPVFPPYSDVRNLLRIWDGQPKSPVLAMINEIVEQTGTPQNPVNWSDPDSWIRERLAGYSSELARRIWLESHGQVNPRDTYGSYLFINSLKKQIVLYELDEAYLSPVDLEDV